MRDAFDLLIGFADGLHLGLPRLLTLAALGLAGSWLFGSSRADRLRRLNGSFVEWIVLAIALAGGICLVLSEASVFDDAYISFRYVRNFVDGHGLVFNLGERVEGYSNFAWVMLIALGHRVTGLEIPLVALVLSLVSWTANIVVIWRLSKCLRGRLGSKFTLSVAVVLVAVQSTYVEFGTTGLETGFCSLMVNLGLYQLVVRSRERHSLAGGAFLIMATLGRPDHGLMYAAGGFSLLWLHGPGLWLARRKGLGALRRSGLGDLLAFSLPLGVYLTYLGWKLNYYGEILPNTYYAKSAGTLWLPQGGFYTTIFLLQSNMILLVPLFFIWLKWRAVDETTRRFKSFVGPTVVVYTAYVVMVGGDFMHGRFFVSLIPLVLLGVEHLLLRIYLEARRSGANPAWRLRLMIVTPILLCSVGGIDVFRPGQIIGGIAKENTFYRLVEWFPVRVDNHNYRTGKILGKLEEGGVKLLIACNSAGMIGYYSKLPLIDLFGLTDYQIARQHLPRRERPGHEKLASRAYIDKRDPILIGGWRTQIDVEHRRVSAVKLGDSPGPWELRGYPVNLIEQIRRLAPEIEIVDIVSWTDRFIRRNSSELPSTEDDLDQLERDIEFIRDYYLERNADSVRREQIDAIAKAAHEAAPL